MHICFITPEYPPETGWGGIAAYTYEMSHGLVRSGHRVTVIALATDGERICEDDGVVVHRVCPAPDLNRVKGGWRLHGYWPGFAWAAWKRVGDIRRRDTVHVAEMSESGGWAIPGVLHRGIPRVIRLHLARYFTDRHNEAIPERKMRVLHAQERWSIRHASAVTAPSVAVADLTAPWAGIQPGTISVVPNPISLDRFRPEGSSDSQTVLYVGRLETQKGMHTLTDVIPRVLSSRPDTRFRLVGDDQRDARGESWETRIRTALAANQIERVEFLRCSRDQLPEIYRQAAVCIIPSRWENFPYVALEAMASGLPVIASKVGGLPEMVVDGETGILVPPEDADSLARAIDALLRNPTDRIRMGQSAYARARALYSVTAVLPRAIDLYESVARG